MFRGASKRPAAVLKTPKLVLFIRPQKDDWLISCRWITYSRSSRVNNVVILTPGSEPATCIIIQIRKQTSWPLSHRASRVWAVEWAMSFAIFSLISCLTLLLFTSSRAMSWFIHTILIATAYNIYACIECKHADAGLCNQTIEMQSIIANRQNSATLTFANTTALRFPMSPSDYINHAVADETICETMALVQASVPHHGLTICLPGASREAVKQLLKWASFAYGLHLNSPRWVHSVRSLYYFSSTITGMSLWSLIWFAIRSNVADHSIRSSVMQL